jgi:glycine cleavage system pyridoxal-binding protein P
LDKQIEILENENIPASLKQSDPYIYRHIGNSEISTYKMLETIGCKDLDELINQVVPDSIKLSSEQRFKHNGVELKGIDSETLMLNRMR